jgi:hypothetical protein
MSVLVGAFLAHPKNGGDRRLPLKVFPCRQGHRQHAACRNQAERSHDAPQPGLHLSHCLASRPADAISLAVRADIAANSRFAGASVKR